MEELWEGRFAPRNGPPREAREADGWAQWKHCRRGALRRDLPQLRASARPAGDNSLFRLAERTSCGGGESNDLRE
jgi:hypothetical protein